MPSKSLKEYLYNNKDHLIQRMRDRWLSEPESAYKNFILKTEEGQLRLKVWISLFLDALYKDREEFFKDQHRIGYSRAIQGLKLENVVKNIPLLMATIWEILPDALAEKELRPHNLYTEIKDLSEILFEDYQIMATSYVKTREALINEKVSQLQTLFDFTREIIAFSELEDVVNLLLKKSTTLFGAEKGYLVLYRNHNIRNFFGHPEGSQPMGIEPVIEKTWNKGVPYFIDEEGGAFEDIDLFKLKRIVAVPILIRDTCHGVIVLRTSTGGFRFMQKELEFLNQLINIMAVAMENIFMLAEIEQHRQELRLITTKMINIQEEERRRLAGDIHDSVAQSLVGISYKIQFCKELLQKKPELLSEQLDGLLETINRTVDQSRELISSLRPDLIDTVGLVPALKRHIESFEHETGIKVDASLSKTTVLSSESSICLFRLAQEALMNVYKHAEIKTADVTLKKEKGNAILIVSDSGKGFDMSSGAPWIKNQDKLGLLSMKERVETVGGSFAIHTGINKGCQIKAKVPLDSGRSHNEQD